MIVFRSIAFTSVGCRSAARRPFKRFIDLVVGQVRSGLSASSALQFLGRLEVNHGLHVPVPVLRLTAACISARRVAEALLARSGAVSADEFACSIRELL